MLITALLVNVASVAALSAESVPVVANDTPKSMHEFSTCFMAIQERQGRPLWIVPNEDGGGRISNDGARGVTNPYGIRFTPSSGRNDVQVVIAKRDSAEEQIVLDAVRDCW